MIASFWGIAAAAAFLVFASDLHLFLANRYANSNHFGCAETHYLRASRFNPLDERAWYRLGELYHEKSGAAADTRMLERALSCFKRAALLHPADYRIDLNILDLERQLRQRRLPAYSALKKLCRKYPSNRFLEDLKQREARSFRDRLNRKTLERRWIKRFGPPKANVVSGQFIGKTPGAPREIESGALYWSTDLFAVLRLNAPEGRVAVSARGESAGGAAPVMKLFLDGILLGEFSVSGMQAGEYEAAYKDISRDHALLRVRFVNDWSNPENNEDRNLYIDSVSVR